PQQPRTRRRSGFSPTCQVRRAEARPTNRGGARMNISVPRPVVLDIGGSLGTMRRFTAQLDAQLPAQYGTVFTGSGDFHHLSWPLIARLKPAQSIQVVVLDNHPDNMRFPFGVHCGSWVRRVAALPFVEHVHVLGITSHDIGAGHAWENYLAPLLRGKLTYWSMGVDTGWSRRLGIA